VKPTVQVPPGLQRVAGRRAGVVSRQDALGAGLSDQVVARLVGSGRWRRLAAGVYATTPDSWEQRVWAGLVLGGDSSVAGLGTAARLWNLPVDRRRRAPAEPPVEIFIGQAAHRPESAGPWRFIRGDRVGQASPPRTSIAQTIVDLATVLTGDELAALVGQTISQRRVAPAQISTALAQATRHRQRALLAGIVADAAGGVTSALEWHFVHDVERPHGLPVAQRQAKPVGIYTVDNLYEDYALIVELDSQAYHRGVAAARDLERDQVHAHHGYLTVRYTWYDVVDHPCRTALHLANTLARRGWTGQLGWCRRCGGSPKK
jgi:very-short-patch-repair endonuclease